MAKKRYDGSVRAVVLNWIETVVDLGSPAPMGVFMATFRAAGVDIGS